MPKTKTAGKPPKDKKKLSIKEMEKHNAKELERLDMLIGILRKRGFVVRQGPLEPKD